MDNKSKKIDRLEFLKIMGATAVATTAAVGCSSSGEVAGRGGSSGGGVPKGQISMRKTKDGKELSLLGYGCMRWPLLESPEAGTNVIDQQAVNELVDYAMEHGVNYFDTAPVYCQGWSETTMGIALSRHPRESYAIATKLSNMSNHTLEASIKLYKRSFEVLKVDYIDYYVVHSVGRSLDVFNSRVIDNGMIDYLIEERAAGRIKNLGWSFHGESQFFDEILALHEKVHWDFVQIQLNYSDWRHARGSNINAEYLWTELEKRDIQIVVMEPLLGGRLSKVPDHIVERFKRRDPEASVASWAFRFAGSHKNVITVLSGMTYMEHLQENITTYSPLKELDEDEFEFLEQTAVLMMDYPTIDCNDCQYCMPCPYGINIPAILLHYNKCVNEGYIAQSSTDSNYREARRAYLVGYNRAVPELRQADRCISCMECVPHCPQGIDIPAELTRIDQYIEKLKQETL